MFLQSLKFSRTLSVAMIVSGLCAIGPAYAEEHPVHLGHHGAFDAYSYREAPNVTAYYITSHPTESQPENVKRSAPHFVATCRGPKVEPHFYLGFPVQKNAELSIDGKKFNLVGHEEGFWGKNDAEDYAIVQALRQGSTAVVTATSTRGTQVVETYSLSGMTSALKAIEAGCATNGASAQKSATPASAAPTPAAAPSTQKSTTQKTTSKTTNTKAADKGSKTQVSKKSAKVKSSNNTKPKKDKKSSETSEN